MSQEPQLLFVYGIFLDQYNRDCYGMLRPSYAVVPNYITTSKGGSIVEAVPVPASQGAALTGVLVDFPMYTPDGEEFWTALDRLEYGYDRIIVTTTEGDRAYMYVKAS